MTILVLCSDYPSKESIALQFVHVRNIEYQKNGIDVTVLNFSADHDYIQDGIKVISFQSYIDENGAYDVLICHAPNIRNHYFFLKKFGNRFKNNIFFFHGHEIVKIGKTYPLNYDFFKNEALKRVIQSIYDVLKLKIWKRYFNK